MWDCFKGVISSPPRRACCTLSVSSTKLKEGGLFQNKNVVRYHELDALPFKHPSLAHLLLYTSGSSSLELLQVEVV